MLLEASKLRQSLDFLLDLFFPVECLCCGQAHEYVCSECLENCIEKPERLPCPVCEEASLLGTTHSGCQSPLALDGICSVGNYKNPLLQELLKKFKYKNVKNLSSPLSLLLCLYIQKNFPAFMEKENLYLTFVPLHANKEAWRGYNQSRLLAQDLAQKLNLELMDALERSADIPSQTKLSRQERKKNVLNTFSIRKNTDLAGKDFFLVDDVSTTGATLKECAKVLKRNGAGSVWAITLAKEF